MKADAIDMERKVCVLESELANEKDKVKGLERQVLAERSVNFTSSTSNRKRKSWDDCSSRQKKRRIEDIKEKIAKVDDDDFEVTEITLRSPFSFSLLECLQFHLVSYSQPFSS